MSLSRAFCLRRRQTALPTPREERARWRTSAPKSRCEATPAAPPRRAQRASGGIARRRKTSSTAVRAPRSSHPVCAPPPRSFEENASSRPPAPPGLRCTACSLPRLAPPEAPPPRPRVVHALALLLGLTFLACWAGTPSYFFRNRSTRPAVSTSLYLPVKNGWQLAQISTWNEPRVER